MPIFLLLIRYYFLAKSSSSLGQSPWNFATSSKMCGLK